MIHHSARSWIIALLWAVPAVAAPKRVLFLGNSFTWHNSTEDVPGTFSNIAINAGNEAPQVSYNTPGGYTLYGHLINSTSRNLIAQGGWDYVVLQEQSVQPACYGSGDDPMWWFVSDVSGLYDLVKTSSPNAKVVLYETWAWSEDRIQQGNVACSGPDAATMQARISLAYHTCASNVIASGRTHVIVAHVGDAREINRTHTNLNMFSDASHMNAAGTYLAGLVMYSTMYNADPMAITYVKSGVSGADAPYIRFVARHVANVPQPNPPLGLSAAGSNAQVALVWDAAERASNYVVKRSASAGGPFVPRTTTVATAWSDVAVTNGITYYYVVSATNAAGESPDSFGAAATPNPILPSVPTGLTASPTNAQIWLTWNASTNATGYNVKRSLVGGGPYVIRTNIPGTVYTDSGLTNGTPYYYVVSAVNGDGETANSTPVAATPWASPVRPHLPTDLSVTPGVAQAVITWSAAPYATAYNVKRGAVTNVMATIGRGVPGFAFVDMTASNGVSYFYTVSGTNSVGEGTNATPIRVTILKGEIANRATGGTVSASADFPPTESADKAFDGNTATKWYNLDAGAAGWLQYRFGGDARWMVTRYELCSANDMATRDPRDWQFQGSHDGTNWTTLDSRTGQVFSAYFSTNTYVTTNAVAFNRYRLNIVTNGGAAGLQLSEFRLFAWHPFLPDPPTGLTASVSGGQVALRWSAASNAVGYVVKRAAIEGGPHAYRASSTTTNFTDAWVTNGSVYYYVVCATNGAGESANSGEVSAALWSAFQQWQMKHFGSLTGETAAAEADADGDGQSNYEEFLAGTQPTNPASFFAADRAAIADGFTIRWPSVSGRLYQVRWDSSPAGGWTDGVIVTGDPAAATTAYTDSAPSEIRFYRVEVKE